MKYLRKHATDTSRRNQREQEHRAHRGRNEAIRRARQERGRG